MKAVILERLFGSAAKLKIIKLFLFNPDSPFDINLVIRRAKVSQNAAKRECSNLKKIGLLRTRSFYKSVRRKIRGKKTTVKKRASGWMLNRDFEYLEPLDNFLRSMNPFKDNAMVSKISKTGRIQLLLISGFFVKDSSNRADLLIVGEGIKKSLLEKVIATMESEIGREVRYAVFDTRDFQYRYYMYDKLIRDILDYPHQKIINRLNI